MATDTATSPDAKEYRELLRTFFQSSVQAPNPRGLSGSTDTLLKYVVTSVTKRRYDRRRTRAIESRVKVQMRTQSAPGIRGNEETPPTGLVVDRASAHGDMFDTAEDIHNTLYHFSQLQALLSEEGEALKTKGYSQPKLRGRLHRNDVELKTDEFVEVITRLTIDWFNLYSQCFERRASALPLDAASTAHVAKAIFCLTHSITNVIARYDTGFLSAQPRNSPAHLSHQSVLIAFSAYCITLDAFLRITSIDADNPEGITSCLARYTAEGPECDVHRFEAVVK